MEDTAPLKGRSPNKETENEEDYEDISPEEGHLLKRAVHEYEAAEPTLDAAGLYNGPHTPAEFNFRETLKVLALNTIPPILIYLCIFSIKNVTLYFLKKQNNNHLVDSFGVACSFLQVIGTTVYIALCIGLTSCSAQAFGNRKFELFGIYLHRGLIVNLIVLIPCGVLLYFAGNICDLFGFHPEIAKTVGDIIFPCLIGVFFGMLYSTQNAYLNAAEIFVPSAIALGIGAICFWFVSYLVFEVYHMGLSAIPISFNTFHIVSSIVLFAYIKIYDPVPGTFFWFKKASFQELWTLFKYEFYVGSMIFLEWICVEINYLMSGSLPIVQVTAITIGTINYSNWYAVPISLADTVLAFMGNSLGERDLKKAKNFLKSGLCFAGGFILIVVSFYSFFAKEAASFYTNDPEVIKKTVDLLRLYILLYPGDCLQIVLSSGLRALGKEKLGSIMFVVCFYMLGIPLSYILGFPAGWGIMGITAGYIIGLYVMLVWMLFVYWKLDWNVQLKEVIERIHQDKQTVHHNED